jgi:hypothetical protein
MFLRWIFNSLSEGKKAVFLKQRGIVLGSRIRNGRNVYLYMIGNFFVEVIYKNDRVNEPPENLVVFSNLNNLNLHLENDFKRAF